MCLQPYKQVNLYSSSTGSDKHLQKDLISYDGLGKLIIHNLFINQFQYRKINIKKLKKIIIIQLVLDPALKNRVTFLSTWKIFF